MCTSGAEETARDTAPVAISPARPFSLRDCLAQQSTHAVRLASQNGPCRRAYMEIPLQTCHPLHAAPGYCVGLTTPAKLAGVLPTHPQRSTYGVWSLLHFSSLKIHID